MVNCLSDKLESLPARLWPQGGVFAGVFSFILWEWTIIDICKRCACLLIYVVFFLVLNAHIAAANGQGEAVRMGFYEDGDYMSRNHSGEYVGFNFEYFQKIAKYAGWNYEIVL